MRLLETNYVEVKRMGKAQNIRGIMTREEDETFMLKASVQPETNMRYVRETFGGHVESAIKLYMKTNLLLRKDQILWDGVYYEVSEIRPYKVGHLDHYKAIAILVKNDT